MPDLLHLVSARLRGKLATTRLAASSLGWSPYSRLVMVSDTSRWVLSHEAKAIGCLANRMGASVVYTTVPPRLHRQAIFYTSQYALTRSDLGRGGNRVAVAYFHGRPAPEDPSAWAVYQGLLRHRSVVSRVQVAHSQMQDVVLNAGVPRERVFLIRIGIDLNLFPAATPETKAEARDRLGIPRSAVVVGSFQKDGVGWGDGHEPKLIKGPDVFLEVMDRLRSRCPELLVLLSGPARGYVKAGLEKRGIPYVHRYVDDYAEIGALYRALDLYLVTSRDEGGPKAVLESMAVRVPLVSTRVGQAADLVRHGWNGWLADVDDVDALTHWALHALHRPRMLDPILSNGRQTAEVNSYEKQEGQWRSFFRGFVEGV